LKTLKIAFAKVNAFYLFLLDFPYQLQQYLQDELNLERSKFFPDATKIRQYSILNHTPLIQKIHQEILLADEKI